MTAARADLSEWFDQGVTAGFSHMIVVCDTFDYDNYPLYVTADNFWERHESHNGPNMTRVDEVYDLTMDKELQMNEPRAFHFPPRSDVNA